MATCLKHNQSYDVAAGEYCVYCGNPSYTVTVPSIWFPQKHICEYDFTITVPVCKICGRAYAPPAEPTITWHTTTNCPEVTS